MGLPHTGKLFSLAASAKHYLTKKRQPGNETCSGNRL